MIKILPLFFLVLLSFQAFANQEKQKNSANCICSQIWEPVCGEDGKTYSNVCAAHCADVKVSKEGQCSLQAEQTAFEISSPAFKHQGKIPKKFSCQGNNISPPLMWTKAPAGVKSYVLIMIDYDAKQRLGHAVTHWIVYDIVPNVHYLTTGAQNIIVGRNSYNKKGYIGMCPAEGPQHHYYFDLYALDVAHLDVPELPSEEEVTRAMKNHIVAKTSIVATYQKQ